MTHPTTTFRLSKCRVGQESVDYAIANALSVPSAVPRRRDTNVRATTRSSCFCPGSAPHASPRAEHGTPRPRRARPRRRFRATSLTFCAVNLRSINSKLCKRSRDIASVLHPPRSRISREPANENAARHVRGGARSSTFRCQSRRYYRR